MDAIEIVEFAYSHVKEIARKEEEQRQRDAAKKK